MATQPRATIATRVFTPEGSAAAYRLGALAHALDKAGFATTVLTTRPPEAVAKTANIRRWPVLRDRSGAVRGYLQYASFDIPLFFRLLFGPRADVVIVEPPPTTGVVTRLACALRRIPYIYYSADVSSTAAEGIGVSPFVVRILRAVESWVLRGARRVLTVSPEVADELVRLGSPRDRIVVVGTGIDTEAFGLAGTVAGDGVPYFVYGGTVSEIQGAGVFVDAFALVAAQHPTARLKYFGGGVEFEQLRQRAATADRVDVHATVGANELAPWIRGAVAGLASVRPQRGYDFAFATKALVSLSCGTPVIYAGVGPLAEVVKAEKLGWAVDWDARAVAGAMTEALKTPTVNRVALSRWIDENYSLDAVADRAVAGIGAALRPVAAR